MNKEKLQEVFSDKEFVKSLFEMKTAAEAQAALKEKGVELTEEEILGIRELVAKVSSGEISAEQLEKGELPEELLEKVSGGLIHLIVGIGSAVVGIANLVSWLCED